jgi:hypothetical protein
MRREIEHDLYPPDEEHTPALRHARNRAAVGTALVVWGTALLVQQVLAVSFPAVALAAGAGALAGWARLRRYGWFVAGAVLTAAGSGEVVRAFLHHSAGRSLSALLLAGAFLAVYVRYPTRSSWALVPAALFGLIAAAAAGVAVLGLVPAVAGAGAFPLLLVIAGTVLLVRQAARR